MLQDVLHLPLVRGDDGDVVDICQHGAVGKFPSESPVEGLIHQNKKGWGQGAPLLDATAQRKTDVSVHPRAVRVDAGHHVVNAGRGSNQLESVGEALMGHVGVGFCDVQEAYQRSVPVLV